MATGTPEDLVQGVAEGVDMFDCVMPTRNARNGQALTWHGRVNIKQARNKLDLDPIDPRCEGPCCNGSGGRYTRGYLRHLFLCGEILAARQVVRVRVAGVADRLDQRLAGHAIAGRQRVQFRYRDAGAQGSQRTVRPLGCFFWGQVWTLGAWCELRQDFRSFRLDRIDALATQDSRFRHEPGRGLADYLRHAGAPAHALTGGGG